MVVAIAALLGALAGVGLLLVRAGLMGRVVKWPTNIRISTKQKSSAVNQQELVEAIASWTEQLRDTIAAAHGLEQAIGATSELAPLLIADAVRRLAAGLRYGGLEDALRRFAEDVNHPSCDFVASALITATRHQARELGPLLTHLSECSREESRVQLRVWVGRARIRSAVRIVVWVVAIFVSGLFILDRPYLAPFATGQGAVVLVAIIAVFSCALVMLRRLGDMPHTARFIARRETVLP
ncbi:MAG: pilus assembly protein TadB [Ilumatobacteraceae bacterium]|nr:pilus assembly protein TadB [Ilumatobacteraceae bacterium]